MKAAHVTGRLRGASRSRTALLLVPLMLCAPGSATGAAAEAPAAVPTCRGVPATIVGSPKADRLIGTPGDDVIVGGNGKDTISGGRGDDLICGGPLGRTNEDLPSQHLSGGPGDDTVVGGRGPDTLFGGGGSDLLLGHGNSDGLLGGEGRDVMRGGPGLDGLDGQEEADLIVGGRGDDFLGDAFGSNTLMGGEGSDHIDSGRGNETINGGAGRDEASYTNVLSRRFPRPHCQDITADLRAGTASGTGFGVDVLQDIEDVSSGGGNDVLIGDDAANSFFAQSSCFEPFTESVIGNGGTDHITFRETVDGDDNSPGPVRVDLQNQTASQAQLGLDRQDLFSLDSIENVSGTEFHDVILGDAGPNRLDSGIFTAGDRIAGRGGDDRLTGGLTIDRLLGGSGDDVLRGIWGNDHLDGGTGQNRNDGGRGVDTCLRPSRGSLAVNCER